MPVVVVSGFSFLRPLDKILPHTLNGSALAVGRTLVAIVENFYDGNNAIHVPKSLQKYLNREVITCK